MAPGEHENRRLELQTQLDGCKTQEERNRLGQFATPSVLAGQIVAHALSFVEEEEIRFLDPGFGTGSFYSALRQRLPQSRIAAARGFEIDPHYGAAAKRLWKNTGLLLQLCDFRTAAPPTADSKKANLLVCNPPYVRHHHLTADDKLVLQRVARDYSGVSLNGLAGLYCYFLLMSHAWMSEGGTAAWLIPSEFMDVNYGRQVKKYLLEQVTLLHVHRFDPHDVQFGDALVSSAVLVLRKQRPAEGHRVKFTFGGTLEEPRLSDEVAASDLRDEPKWSRFPAQTPRARFAGRTLADLFTIKRGLATGANSFFILPSERAKELRLPREYLIPILPSPRYLEVDEIPASPQGEPEIARKLYLLSCDLPPGQIQADHPALGAYFEQGIRQGLHERYLCKHRTPWYSQERRPPAPFLCTYMGRQGRQRKTPFRFILNHSNAAAANVYLLLYPKPELKHLLDSDATASRKLWRALSAIGDRMLLDESRVYGGGLHKLEPKELANVPADAIAEALGMPGTRGKQQSLF